MKGQQNMGHRNNAAELVVNHLRPVIGVDQPAKDKKFVDYALLLKKGDPGPLFAPEGRSKTAEGQK